MSSPFSLTQHILAQERLHPEATGEFSAMMTQIALGGKMIAQDLRQAGLLDILGSTGEVNVQGEEVQKLDQRANDTFVQVFDSSTIVRTVISEEMEDLDGMAALSGDDPARRIEAGLNQVELQNRVRS